MWGKYTDNEKDKHSLGLTSGAVWEMENMATRRTWPRGRSRTEDRQNKMTDGGQIQI